MIGRSPEPKDGRARRDLVARDFAPLAAELELAHRRIERINGGGRPDFAMDADLTVHWPDVRPCWEEAR